jgi:hypothetical protein
MGSVCGGYGLVLQFLDFLFSWADFEQEETETTEKETDTPFSLFPPVQ